MAEISHKVLTALTFLAMLAAGDGCSPTTSVTTKTPPGSTVTYKKGPTLDIDLKHGDHPELAKRAAISDSDVISAENFFLEVDTNDDGVLDACDWLQSSFNTRVKDYANMLSDLDLDGDDALTFDEFKALKIIAKKM